MGHCRHWPRQEYHSDKRLCMPIMSQSHVPVKAVEDLPVCSVLLEQQRSRHVTKPISENAIRSTRHGLSCRSTRHVHHSEVMVQAALSLQPEASSQGASLWICLAEDHPSHARVRQGHRAHSARLPDQVAVPASAQIWPAAEQRSCEPVVLVRRQTATEQMYVFKHLVQHPAGTPQPQR